MFELLLLVFILLFRFLYETDSKEFALYADALARLKLRKRQEKFFPPAQKRRRSPSTSSDDDNERLTNSPPLPSLSKHNQEPPPWLRTPAPTPEASVTSSRVSAAQASLPGSLAVGVAPPNPAQVSMSAVPPPADLDRGVDADTEDADGAYNLRLYLAIQYYMTDR